MSVSQLAAGAQSSGGYAVDAWIDFDDIRVAAAVGICRTNAIKGSGSVFQYYIPDWRSALFRTGRRYDFRHQKY